MSAAAGLAAAGLAAAAVAILLAPGAGAVRLSGVVAAGRQPPRAGTPRRAFAGLMGRTAQRAGRPRAVTALQAAVSAAACLALGGGPAAAALLASAVVAANRWWDRRARTAADEAERARAVEACTALAGELRAGRSPAQALEVAAGLAVGPSRAALTTAAAAAGLGGDVGQALRPRTEEVGAVPQVLRSLAACWTVCSGSGGGLAAAVERLEQGLRADQAQRRAVQAELAGPRATAGMLAVLPLAGLLLAAGLGADPLHVLFETPVGLACLGGGLAMDVLGLLWTGRLVRRAGGGR